MIVATHGELTNGVIAELLAAEAERARPPLDRALRRAARRALLWPEEAATLLHDQRSLTELPSIGPYLEKLMLSWFDDPPPVPVPVVRARQARRLRDGIPAVVPEECQ